MSTTVHLNRSDVAIIVEGYRVGNPDEFFCIDFTEQGVATEFYLTRDQLSTIAHRALEALRPDDAIEVPEIVAPVEAEAVVDAPLVCDNCGGAVVVEDGDYKHAIPARNGTVTFFGCQYHTLDSNDKRYATVNGNDKVPESEVAS